MDVLETSDAAETGDAAVTNDTAATGDATETGDAKNYLPPSPTPIPQLHGDAPDNDNSGPDLNRVLDKPVFGSLFTGT